MSDATVLADAALRGLHRIEPAVDAWEAGRDPGDPERTGGEPAAEPRWRFLRPMKADDLYADPALDEMRWLWRDFIPEASLVMLASFMKEGKSTLVYALLGAMASGHEFLGRPTCRVPVLVLAVEEHLRDVKAHLIESGVGPEAPVTIHAGLYPNTQDGLAELRSFITTNGIKLVVIDTLSRFWRIENENDAAEVIRHLGPLLDMARGLGIAVLLLHHTGKGQQGVEFDHGREIRGSSAIFGLVDQALILRRAKGGSATMRVLRAVGRFRETPEELLIDFDEEQGYRLVESSVNASDRDHAREQKILGYIAMSPGCTRTKAQQGAKVGRQRGLRLIESLIREGSLVERDGGLHVGSGGVAELSGTRGTGSRVPAPLKGGPGTTPGTEARTLRKPAGTGARIMIPDLAALAREAPLEELPALLGRLAEAEAIARMRINAAAVPAGATNGHEHKEADRLLTVEQAIVEVGGAVSRKWLLRHTRGLRFHRDLSRKVVRFEEAGLRRWVSARRT